MGASGKVRRIEKVIEEMPLDSKDTIYVSKKIRKLIEFKRLSEISYDPKKWRKQVKKLVQPFSQSDAKKVMKKLLANQTERYNEIVFTIDKEVLPKAIKCIRVFAEEEEEITEEAKKKAKELQKALKDILNIKVDIKRRKMNPVEGNTIGADSMK